MDAATLTLIMWLIAGGALAGFAAGMFGIGGGAVMVPLLSFVLRSMGYPDAVIMHCAVATSSAVIIVSALRSVASHHKHGAVDWDILWPKQFWKSWGLWIGAGALLGSGVLARHISGNQLEMIFGVIMCLIAAQFIIGRPDWKLRDDLPGGLALPGFGGAIGALSALMGIGGGAISVSLMALCGKPIHRAIGTASGVGVFIAIPATLGFILSGQGIIGRPPFSLGYVSLLGFAILAATSIVFVPLGARLAHNTDQKPLKIIFGIFLLAVSIKMIAGAIGG
ncbi:MAG: sulfite exporter TauE/SafE family protein [Robiginitomaculum sp.]